MQAYGARERGEAKRLVLIVGAYTSFCIMSKRLDDADNDVCRRWTARRPFAEREPVSVNTRLAQDRRATSEVDY
jgi:hypothetical protein